MDNAVKIYKGTISDVDSYSVFWDNKKLTQTTLGTQLSQLNATDIYVCGLAYDVCVGNTKSSSLNNKIICDISFFCILSNVLRYLILGATAADAMSIGYRTILIDDCCRGVDLNDIEKTKNNVVKNHGVIVHSNEVN